MCTAAILGTVADFGIVPRKCHAPSYSTSGAYGLMGVSTATKAVLVHVLSYQSDAEPATVCLWAAHHGTAAEVLFNQHLWKEARLVVFLGKLSREQECEDQLLASKAGGVHL